VKNRNIIVTGLMAAGALLFLFPVILIFITAFKSESEIIHFQGILPSHATLDNFREILGNSEEIPIFRWMANSIFIASATTLLVLLCDSLAAYGLARLRLPGGRYVLALIIATLMIPGQIILIPMYLILNRIGWLDTPWALIVPAGAGAFGVFLLHQFFLEIPRDLEDAATIDGCSRLRIYWNIILPLSKPALSVLAIFTFLASWNDFIGPLVFLESLNKYTLPVGVALFQTSYLAEYGLVLSACVICTIPALVFFLLFQKHIIKGISLSGLKE